MTIKQLPLRDAASVAAASRGWLYVAMFAFLAAYFLAWPIWRSQFLIEIWMTEGWNAYFQDAAASGSPLYPKAASLIVNNYPPLSFYAIGLLGKIFGDNIFVGRMVSLASLIGVAVEIFLCARLLAGGIVGPIIGALWYVAIMSHNSTAYVGANDPQLAGEAIMGAGLVFLLVRDRGGKSPAPALLLMVVGGFWKHNMIGIPLTAIAWLFLKHRAHAIRPVGISALAAGAGLLICATVFGKEFFENLLVARDYGVGHVLGNVGHLQWSAPAFVIWAIWAATNRSAAARFTMVHVPISLGACLLEWLGDATFGNVEFDLILALGIAVGVTFEEIQSSAFARRFGVNAAQATMVAVLVLRLVATDRHEPTLVLLSSDFRSRLAAGERSVRTEAARVALMEGDVYCSNKVVCRLAGKPFVVDDFKVEQMVATGAVTKTQLDDELHRRKIVTVNSDVAGTVTVDSSLSRSVMRLDLPNWF